MGTHVVATTGTVSGYAENTQINEVATQLATMAQGSTPPTASSTGLASIAGLWWHNTSDGTVRVRDQADTAWITIGTINETVKQFQPANTSAGTSLPSSGGTLTGGLIVQAGGVNITAGGLVVAAGGVAITGPLNLNGNVAIGGTGVFWNTVEFHQIVSFDARIFVSNFITSTAGGFVFPDGSVQTTAAQPGGGGASVDLSGYAPLSSPALRDIATAPTVDSANNSTQIATTAFVQAVVAKALAIFQSTGSTGGGMDQGGG